MNKKVMLLTENILKNIIKEAVTYNISQNDDYRNVVGKSYYVYKNLLDLYGDISTAQNDIYQKWAESGYSDRLMVKYSRGGRNSAKYDTAESVLVDSLIPWICEVVNKFYKRSSGTLVSKNELLNVCLEMVMKRLRTYDPVLGSKLATWTCSEQFLIGRMAEYVNNIKNIGLSSSSLRISQKFTYIKNIWDKYWDKVGEHNKPMDSTDALLLYRWVRGFDGISNEKVLNIFNNVCNIRTTSLDAPLDDDSKARVGDTLVAPAASSSGVTSDEKDSMLTAIKTKLEKGGSKLDPKLAYCLLVGYQAGAKKGNENIDWNEVADEANYQLSQMNMNKQVTPDEASRYCASIIQSLAKAGLNIERAALEEGVLKTIYKSYLTENIIKKLI